MEIYVDDEAKLTLHGLVQHYVMLNEDQKNRKLNDLLDALDFNQVGGTFCSFASPARASSVQAAAKLRSPNVPLGSNCTSAVVSWCLVEFQLCC